MKRWLAGALASLPGMAAAAPVHSQDTQLVAPMRSAGDRFGATVAVAGDVAVVAAPGRSVAPFGGAGEVFLLARSEDAWTVTTGSLTEAATSSTGRALGHSAALHETHMLLGAPGFYGDRGLAYIYAYEGDTWTLKAGLQDPTQVAGSRFGVAVGLALGAGGNHALVGETVETLPVDDKVLGQVLVFDESTAWMLAQTLTPKDAQTGDRFGYALAADGDLAVIGAPGKEGARGAAYMFLRQAGKWQQIDKLVLAGDRVEGDYFGAAVAIAGERVLVGAYGRDGERGAAYVFERDDDTWTQAQELTSDAPMASEWFGVRVALHGERALVSGSGFEVGPIGSRGGGYLFARDETGFRLLAALRTDDGVPGDLLGAAAALTDREVLLGAPYDDASPDLESAPGSAYVFASAQVAGEPCARAEDCGDGTQCCAYVCAADCGGATSDATGMTEMTGMTGESVGSSDTGTGGETLPTTGGASAGTTADDGPHEAQFEAGASGCGCDAGTGADVWSLLGSLGSLAVLPWLYRRRRRGLR